MNLRRKVKQSSFYREYVRVLNGILELSPREIEIFSLLLRIDYEWRPILPGDIKNILSSDNRKRVMRETLVNKNNLTKYINTLKEKGLVINTEEGGWQVAPQLLPNMVSGVVRILFILDTNETNR